MLDVPEVFAFIEIILSFHDKRILFLIFRVLKKEVLKLPPLTWMITLQYAMRTFEKIFYPCNDIYGENRSLKESVLSF